MCLVGFGEGGALFLAFSWVGAGVNTFCWSSGGSFGKTLNTESQVPLEKRYWEELLRLSCP